MQAIHFPEWPSVLAQADLPNPAKHSFAITIRWYLSFCQRGRAEVSFHSARDFLAWALQEKQPQPWQVEEWKEAIRWFFRAAKAAKPAAAETKGSAEPGQGVWLPEDKTGWPEWKVQFLTIVRISRTLDQGGNR